MVGMSNYELAISNVLTFLLEHHAEHIQFLSLEAAPEGMKRCTIFLSCPPVGRTMLGWEWDPSGLRGKIQHKTPTGITVIAPEFTR
jgi:hypothetical protein